MKIVRTLLADDHALVRAGLRNALKELPYLEIVGEVGNGPDLIYALEKLQPDCLLIDVTMPDFEPVVTIRQIRARYPQMRILVVSAYDDDVYVQGLLSAGVDGYHLKDQPMSDLRLAVERVSAGERWISSPLLEKLLQPAPERLAKTPDLSPRQQDILVLLSKGFDNRTMASNLELSVKTIENHLTRLYRQLGVQSRLEAASYIRDHPQIIARMGESSSQEHLDDSPRAERVAILLLDDNQRYRRQLRRMIGRAYPQAMIYEAENTTAAIHLTKKVAPKIAFVDVVLGEEDGIRCTRRIKAHSPSSRVILISAYPDREFHRRGLLAGATAFLDKKVLDAATLYQIIDDNIA
jgi:DNA-binding NarL/FixJ family response regulator